MTPRDMNHHLCTACLQVTLFLWRKAASDLYKEAEGSLLLLWSPQVRKVVVISGHLRCT